MNSEPLSESMPRSSNGSRWRICSSASTTKVWLLPITARVSVHAVWMSVSVSEWMNSPSARSPECDTRSISVKPGSSHVPALGLDRDLVLEQRPRLGLPVEPSLRPHLVGLEPTIDLPSADPQQLALEPRRDRQTLLQPRQPHRQQGLQPHRPRVVRRLPHEPQRLIDRLAVARPSQADAAEADSPAEARSGASPRTCGDSPVTRHTSSRIRPFSARPASRYRGHIRHKYSHRACRPKLYPPLGGLHFKWLDVPPFGYILDGAIRVLDSGADGGIA